MSLSLNKSSKNQTVTPGHSSVGRAIDCRSIGRLFDSDCPDLYEGCKSLKKLISVNTIKKLNSIYIYIYGGEGHR